MSRIRNVAPVLRTVLRFLLAALLVVGAVVWVLVNKPWEGAVLVSFTPTRGITVADVPSIVAVGLALLLVIPDRRS